MKNVYLGFFTAFVMALTTANAANFDKGFAAYQAGDYETAFTEFSELAVEGNVDAQYNLGNMYYYGEGVEQNTAAAVRWLTLAAEQGDASAQYNLGFLYGNGEGVVQDYASAVKWFTMAAEQGNVDAQYNLGERYSRGIGVALDFAKANKWSVLAAKQGDARAQLNLGGMYYFGNGVLQDYVLAHMWANIASANGGEGGASLRDFSADHMEQADILIAQRMASECMASNYENCGY